MYLFRAWSKMANASQVVSRNSEATVILRRFFKIHDPALESASLNELVQTLKKRSESASEINPDRVSEVHKLQLQLATHANLNVVERVCRDEIMIDVLKEFVRQNISVEEIIEAVAREEKRQFLENIPPLISQDPEITEDASNSLYETTLNMHDTDNNQETLKIQPSAINSITHRPLIAGGRGQSTPYPIKKTNFPAGLNVSNTAPIDDRFAHRSRTDEGAYSWFAAGGNQPSAPESLQRNNFQSDANSFQPNTTLTPLKNLSIKDALECIAKYDGNNMSLSTFLFGIREARSLIPEVNHPDLAKLVKRRLIGEAAKAMNGVVFHDINDLVKFLEANFGSYKPQFTLLEELAAVRQEKKEKVLNYANRIREISIEIIESQKREKGDDPKFLQSLEENKLKFSARIKRRNYYAYGKNHLISKSGRISNRNRTRNSGFTRKRKETCSRIS